MGGGPYSATGLPAGRVLHLNVIELVKTYPTHIAGVDKHDAHDLVSTKGPTKAKLDQAYKVWAESGVRTKYL